MIEMRLQIVLELSGDRKVGKLEHAVDRHRGIGIGPVEVPHDRVNI